ncbi:APC family permease [Candidatus Methanomassiliicoccus intestinalis]|uniref:Amino acid permease n=2 Tax=Candidatus Methanomassiliicoccus intestinalis TaxID=1406512 RepID=R9T5D8_METII|nr:APC family permease [Candidatus Methanomassiliicoccus intestinalis]AGN25749.1 amino acid permease [Candidatus Methanomassiliicoccus intestinalis Issoire-Mx1]TQS82742.1 MAG: hypothetical protein A3206_07205 [Candidatus Methanomassiliicoccus intestinalis]TQS84099.1 MAG: hypothetical protein A3207_07235 [Candidatus Methanomassiliicoccus intestinalis]
MSELKKSIGLFGATAYGIGTIVGAGVYALIGAAAGEAGNAVWLTFIIASAIAMFTALSYARLSSHYPHSGAEYVYVESAFGKGILPFITGWLVIFSSVVSISAIALGFGGYLSVLIPVPKEISAIALIIIVSLINIKGIRESIVAASIMTVVELIGIAAVVILGAPDIGSVDYFQSPHGIAGVLSAVGIVFFSMIGFEGIVRISEETKNAEKNIPRALVLALVISTIVYVAVSITAVSLIPYSDLAGSSAPLSDAAYAAGGSGAALLMTIIALISTSNTVLIVLIATSRMIYGMAEEGAIPRIFRKVNHKRKTPTAAIAAAMIVAAAFCFIGGIEAAAYLTNFTLFLVFLAVNLSVLGLARKGVKIGRWAVPVSAVGAVSSAVMLFTFSLEIAVISAVIIAIGVAAYLILTRTEKD